MIDPVAITSAHAVLPGRDVPGSEMSNADLSGLMAQVVEEYARRGVDREVPISSPEFPEQRIGIRSRRVLDEGFSARDLAVVAAQRALDAGRIDASSVKCVVVSTVTADRVVPGLATTVHDRLGLPASAPAFDLRVGCNGFLSALDVGQRFLVGQPEGSVALIIGAETMIRVLDASDRATCAIFGDGGGVVIMQRTAAPGMAAVRSLTLGHHGDHIQIRADEPVDHAPMFRFTSRDGQLAIREDRCCRRRVLMAGRQVFKDMLRTVPEFVAGYLDEQRLRVSEVDAFVFHQANLRMIEGIAGPRGLGIPDAALLNNIGEIGNTTSASIPILLGEAAASGRLCSGDRVLLVGFGSGYSLGITLLEWQ